MTALDWTIVALFFAVSVWLGTMFTSRAGQSLEAYFTSNRSLSWWLAGTSIAATAFSSDTPLLVTGMVRRRGIWGTWEILALAVSTMLSVFVFAKLWKRAGVVTEVELVERRYSGRAAAFLRGFKAIYWGLLYNCFVIGAWPVTGLRKVLEETLGLSREWAIVSCVALAAAYTSCSGLWGVMLTDLFQFVWAMVGAVVLACVAVHAVGGLGRLHDALAGGTVLHVLPPMPAPGASWLESPMGWLVGLLLIQWWAWKNSDGGGVVVQRLVSCRDERQAMGSVLWFSIAHYCLRAWPWILTAAASVVLIPDAVLQVAGHGHLLVDHERAYPRLILQLLPAGWRGVMLASFFAAFLSTVSTQLNWGASYLVNDGYKRFLVRGASERHYVAVSRAVPYLLALGAMGVAWYMDGVGQAFTLILNLTAGIGPVYLLRWFWWRINPWSEISAMIVSVPILWARPALMQALGLPHGAIVELLVMVLGTAAVWVPVTLATPPVDRATLKRFYAAVRPPGWWRHVAIASAVSLACARDPSARDPEAPAEGPERWARSLAQWALGTVAIIATAMGPLELALNRHAWGALVCGVGLAGWVALGVSLSGDARTLRTPSR